MIKKHRLWSILRPLPAILTRSNDLCVPRPSRRLHMLISGDQQPEFHFLILFYTVLSILYFILCITYTIYYTFYTFILQYSHMYIQHIHIQLHLYFTFTHLQYLALAKFRYRSKTVPKVPQPIALGYPPPPFPRSPLYFVKSFAVVAKQFPRSPPTTFGTPPLSSSPFTSSKVSLVVAKRSPRSP